MKDIGETIRNYLLSFARIRDQVRGRIRPDELEQEDVPPAIRYEVATQTRLSHLQGPTPLGFSRLQLDCYGRRRREANDLAEMVIQILHGYSGELEGTTISDCFVENVFDQIDRPLRGQGTSRRRRTIDFMISHSVQVPQPCCEVCDGSDN